MFKIKKQHVGSSPNILLLIGTPDGIRTHALWLRRPTLYPAELLARIFTAKVLYRGRVGISSGLWYTFSEMTAKAVTPDMTGLMVAKAPLGPLPIRRCKTEKTVRIPRRSPWRQHFTPERREKMNQIRDRVGCGHCA